MTTRRKTCSEPGCSNPGKGNPSLCEFHWEEQLYEEEMEEEDEGDDILSRILSHPTVQGLFNRGVDAISGKFDQLSHKLDNYAALYMAAQQAKAQAPKAPSEDPRVVLGFKPEEPLTEEKIKKRQKELAKILHSDKGGYDRSMSRVNEAVEQLLKTL